MSQVAFQFSDPFAALAGPVAKQVRYYQERAIASGRAALEEGRSTLWVMATGTGKTFTGAEFVRRWLDEHDSRVLWLAHRYELLTQARDTLEKTCSVSVGFEQANSYSDRERVVVGSVQTVCRDERMDRMEGFGRFGLIVFDEAHHALAPTFRRPIDRFADASLLGLTATPDRGDEKKLGALFGDYFVFNILDAVDAGFLTPVEGIEVTEQEIDISEVDLSNGDLAAGQLDEAMVAAAEGIAKDMAKHAGEEQGILFTPGVKSAHYCAARLNEMRPGCAAAADASTPRDERAMMVRSFKNGDLQFLVNCMLWTEGFDAPGCKYIGIARPTRQASLYMQMMGRGTRPLEGVLDGLPVDEEGAEVRRAAIAASDKPKVTIIDFVGNSGRHADALISPVDIFGQNYTDAEIRQAKKKLKSEKKADPRQLLEDARAELRRLAKTVRSKVKSKYRRFDPFAATGLSREREVAMDMRFGYKPMTPKQRDILKDRMGLRDEELKGVSKKAASKMIDNIIERSSKGYASIKQMKVLKDFGVTREDIFRDRANAAITYIKGKGFGRHGPVDPVMLDRLLWRNEPGEGG